MNGLPAPSVSESPPLEGGSALSPTSSIGKWYQDQLAKLKNPCYACGRKNALSLRACSHCGLPLPSAAPLSVTDAQNVVEHSFSLRAVLWPRRWGSVGLMLGGVFLLNVTLVFMVQIPTWDEFYLLMGAGSALFVAGIGLMLTSRGRSWTLTRTQVILYKRGAETRLEYRRALRPTGQLLPPAIAPKQTLNSTVSSSLSGALLPSPFDAYQLGPGAWEDMRTFSIQPGFRLRGVSQGLAGRYWTLVDGGGRSHLRMVIDARPNKVYQLSAPDELLCHETKEFWALFRGPTRVGAFVGQAQTDDVRGIGTIARQLLDTAGGEILRIEGNFAPFPSNVRSVLDAYATVRVFLPGEIGPTALRVIPSEDGRMISLVETGGRRVTELRLTPSKGWKGEVAQGIAPSLPVLTALLLLTWNPDGVSIEMARVIETNPKVREALARM